MIYRQKLTYNQTAQLIELPYPPEWVYGAPSAAATYAVWESTQDLDDDAEFSGTASLDSVDTTFDAASGFSQSANRQRANLTATTNVAVGRYYVAANALGQRELLNVKAISSGNYVDATYPLQYDYAAADTFKGLRSYFIVPTSFIQEESNINVPSNPWRVQWTYTINSVQYTTWTEFDVVRADGQVAVTGHDLYALRPDLKYHQWPDERGEHYSRQIKAAQDRMRFDLENRFGITLDQIRDHATQEELHRSCAMWLIAMAGAPPPDGFDSATYAQMMHGQYESDLQHVKEKILLSKSPSGAVTSAGSKPIRFTR